MTVRGFEEGPASEGFRCRKVGQRRDSGKGVANAEEEVAMAQAPEVLGVVVEMPGGPGEYLAGGKFEEKGVDDTVKIFVGFVRQSRDQAVDDKGQKKMFVIDVMDREHGAAVEQKLVRDGLKAETLEGDA